MVMEIYTVYLFIVSPRVPPKRFTPHPLIQKRNLWTHTHHYLSSHDTILLITSLLLTPSNLPFTTTQHNITTVQILNQTEKKNTLTFNHVLDTFLCHNHTTPFHRGRRLFPHSEEQSLVRILKR